MASPRDSHEELEYQYHNLSPILEETESELLIEEAAEKMYQNITERIKNTTDYVNNTLERVMKQRSSPDVAGKEAAPILESLKTLGQKNEDSKNNCRNTEKKLDAALFNMNKALGQNTQNLQIFMEYIEKKKAKPQEKNLSDKDSEASTSKAEDIATSSSSTFDFSEKNDEKDQEE